MNFSAVSVSIGLFFSAIYIDLERFDISANGKSKYFYCESSGYENNVACINSGSYWRLNTEELAIESICYIDAHPENVYVFDQYSWMQQYHIIH